MRGTRILVAIIAYNESKNLPLVVEELRRDAPSYDIVVIDNGSNDNSRQLCKDLGVKFVSHFVNTGSSFDTVLTYFIYAYKNNYDVVCQVDGDFQHKASHLHSIINPIAEGNVDFVIGSRYIDNIGFQSTWLRRNTNRFLSYLVRVVSGLTLTDITSGFKAYGRRPIQYFANDFQRQIHDNISIVLLSRNNGHVIREVPVTMRPREHGVSEFTLSKSFLFVTKALISIVAYLLQKKKA